MKVTSKENKIKKINPFALFFTVMKNGFRDFFKGPFIRGVKKHWLLYLILLPSLFFLIVFSYLPMFGIVTAFQDFSLAEGVFESEWVGLKAFRYILLGESATIYRMFRNTVYISVLRIITNSPAIVVFTLLLNEIGNRKVRSVVHTISLFPHYISWIAVGGICYNLFTVDGGILNQILQLFGKEAIAWYNDPNPWWGIFSVTSLWKGMGWASLVYMSALGSIDDELYDACSIDGGGRFRKMIHVTLPGILNVVMLQIILDVSSIMKDNYEQILALINGSDALTETTYVIGRNGYDTISYGGDYAVATALSFMQGVIGTILVVFTNKIVKKTESEGIL